METCGYDDCDGFVHTKIPDEYYDEIMLARREGRFTSKMRYCIGYGCPFAWKQLYGN